MMEKNVGSSIDKLVVISGRMKNNQKGKKEKKKVCKTTLSCKRGCKIRGFMEDDNPLNHQR
jgi:hypothetical protein